MNWSYCRAGTNTSIVMALLNRLRQQCGFGKMFAKNIEILNNKHITGLKPHQKITFSKYLLIVELDASSSSETSSGEIMSLL